MKEETLEQLEKIVEKDSRYITEAYEFVFAALAYTQKKFKKSRPSKEGKGEINHVSGIELLEGIRELALETYGPMAKSVFEHWGVRKTDDFGEIVFNLVDAKLLGKREEDRKKDFKEVYDFNEVFKKGYKIGSGV